MTNTEFRVGVIKPIECLKEAWELIKPNYWLLFAITLVGIMVGGISLYVLLGAMMCGIYLCYLQCIDGKQVEFETLFKTFKEYILPGLAVTVVMIVPLFIVLGIIYLPLILTMVMGTKLSEGEMMSLFLSALAVDIVFSIFMVCLHTLLMFAFPLIADRNLSGWSAMKLSAKAVWKNLGGVTGIWALMFVVNIVGMLAFCVGIYLTIPIILATQVVAYRKVFPKTGEQSLASPPPPNVFNV